MKFTMYEFALMTRFAELAKRYGLEPWQFGIEYDQSTGETYVTGTPVGAEANGRFRQMIGALGISDDTRTFPQEEGREMLEALDEAIKSVPRKWVR